MLPVFPAQPPAIKQPCEYGLTLAAVLSVCPILCRAALDLRLGFNEKEALEWSAVLRSATGSNASMSLQQLSGGQWRRASIAVTLAYMKLVLARQRIQTNLLVIDELVQHLDSEGRVRVGELLNSLRDDGELTSFETALIIMQSDDAEEISEIFDTIDLVVRRDGFSSVELGYTGSLAGASKSSLRGGSALYS